LFCPFFSSLLRREKKGAGTESLNFNEARQLIARSSRIVGFTGAGISTESGIPDFRSPNGVWARTRMIEFSEYVSSRSARVESWIQKLSLWAEMGHAKPNAGHFAFARLEREQRLRAMITQNIDGLHQRAGSSNVIELHGTAVEVACLSCRARITMEAALERVSAGEEDPECKKCGGILKSATVSFGQMLPEDAVSDAVAAAKDCDIFLSVGSSLVVYPAASLPELAKRNGAVLIIINRTPTPLDGIADLVLNEEIGVALPRLLGFDEAN
jgi:NAD-dependent deacetylase